MMLELKNFRKAFGKELVLDVESLLFDAGLHWIKGRNGSGKSTLLACAAGISPFQGDILLQQKFHPLRHPEAYRSRVNFAEAEPLYPEFLCGRELFEFVAGAKKASSEQKDMLVTVYRLDAYFEKPAASYSSGMSKKLSLAMAFLGKPELILLDEPFITLDHDGVAATSFLVDEYLKKGCSFLMSSHEEPSAGGLHPHFVYNIEAGTIRRSE